MKKDTEPAAEPASGDNAKGDGASADGAPAWTKQLSKELLDDSGVMKQLGKFKNLSELAKSYSELEKRQGKTVVLPDDKSSDEERNAFYKKLGRPDSADDYSVKGDDMKPFREIAYAHNLTDAQAQGLANALAKIGSDAINARKAAALNEARATDAALHAEYGADYNAKIALFRQGMAKYAGQGVSKALGDAGILGNRDIVKMFILLGEQSSEAPSTSRGGGGKPAYRPITDGGTFDSFKDLDKI